MIKRKIKKFLKRVLLNKVTGADLFPSNPKMQVSEDFKTGQYIIVKVGGKANVKIDANVEMREFCNIIVQDGGTLSIEKDVFFNNYCSLNCLHEIKIGEGTLIGEGVKMYDHNHAYDLQPQINVHHVKFTTAPIIVGKHCWIGSNVVLLKGVTIGDNVIIGSNNLIYKSIPSNTIVKVKTELIMQQY